MVLAGDGTRGENGWERPQNKKILQVLRKTCGLPQNSDSGEGSAVEPRARSNEGEKPDRLKLVNDPKGEAKGVWLGLSWADGREKGRLEGRSRAGEVKTGSPAVGRCGRDRSSGPPNPRLLRAAQAAAAAGLVGGRCGEAGAAARVPWCPGGSRPRTASP